VVLHGDGGIAVQEPKPRIVLTFLVGFLATAFVGAFVYAISMAN
jgi:hypothetical protein